MINMGSNTDSPAAAKILLSLRM
uniref:Uncharacterized protein n=1 Tax=Arundo donax TaxID=35708 RepID=A0A0A8Y4Y8_ARUDO